MRGRGEGLVHPVPIVAILVLVLNDHLLKETFHNAFTGKLSDVAGMIFFPLLLQAGTEFLDRREPFRPNRHVLISCVLATALVFSVSNLFSWGAQAYRVGLGVIQWPFRCLLNFDLVSLSTVHHTLDPTDVIAAPFVAVALAVGWSRHGSDRHP